VVVVVVVVALPRRPHMPDNDFPEAPLPPNPCGASFLSACI
jgi:hypothetical protein